MSDVLQGELVLQFQQAIAQLQSASKNTERLTNSLNKAGLAATGMQTKLRAAGAAAAAVAAGAGAGVAVDPFRAMVDRQKVSVLAAQERVRAYRQAHDELGLSLTRSSKFGDAFANRMQSQMIGLGVGMFGFMSLIQMVERAISGLARRIREAGKNTKDFTQESQEIMVDSPRLRKTLAEAAPLLSTDEGLSAAKAYVGAGGDIAEKPLSRAMAVASRGVFMGWGPESTARLYARLQKDKVQAPEDFMALYAQAKGTPMALGMAATDRTAYLELKRMGRKAGPAAAGAFGKALESQPRDSADFVAGQVRMLQGQLELRKRSDIKAMQMAIPELKKELRNYGKVDISDALGPLFLDSTFLLTPGIQENLPVERQIAQETGEGFVPYAKASEDEKAIMRARLLANPELAAQAGLSPETMAELQGIQAGQLTPGSEQAAAASQGRNLAAMQAGESPLSGILKATFMPWALTSKMPFQPGQTGMLSPAAQAEIDQAMTANPRLGGPMLRALQAQPSGVPTPVVITNIQPLVDAIQSAESNQRSRDSRMIEAIRKTPRPLTTGE